MTYSLNGIAPTLIIVRVGTGRSFETTHMSTIQGSSWRFAGPTTSTARSVAGGASDNVDPVFEAQFVTPVERVAGGDVAGQLGGVEKWESLPV
ncbi:hypothetical protein DENSPDRAFT_838433 [Dentipellis sp. KUC8613]|nr:hypothetical protein DENSPDRAFT_838433 [Dentipellis sp. KUC8613]